MKLCRLVILSLCCVCTVSCAKILAVIPTLSKSHYVVFEVLLKELARRGHDVTAVSTFPQPKPVENLREISLVGTRYILYNNFSIDTLPHVPESFFDVAHKFFMYIDSTEQVLNATGVLDLISSKDSFDLVINEMFIDDVFLAFAHKFNAPVVSFGSCYMFPWVADRFAIPSNPSYVPTFYSGGYGPKMSFMQRIRNTFFDVTARLFFNFWLEPVSTEITRKYFGASTPPTSELVKNISLYFINTHVSMFGGRPYPPQVVDVSGIHLKPPRPLQPDLDKWMNESSAGVVYFSFGSMLRGATLPADKVKAFLTVFGTLPQRVLWKWEDDAVEADRLPTNVKIMKWLPQRDVLAHPNVRAFISHGGLLGTTEAVVSGVPVLGIPMYGDQPNNVAALVERGVAVHVDYNNISVASLTYALDALLNDNSYSENAKGLSARFLDRPMSPLDTAVYWTEYVIRHRGAPHLQSAAVHLTWYQYYLLDVLALFLLAVCLTLATIYYTLRSCLRLVVPSKSTKLKSN